MLTQWVFIQDLGAGCGVMVRRWGSGILFVEALRTALYSDKLSFLNTDSGRCAHLHRLLRQLAHRSVSIREFNVIYVIHNHFANVSKNSFSTKGVSVIARGTHNRQTFSQLISPRQSPQHRHMMACDVETHMLM